MGHNKLHRAAVTLLLTLNLVWKNFIQAILWTPANAHLKFTSSGSKWLYFQFQSGLVHSLVIVITAVGVLFHVDLSLILCYLARNTTVIFFSRAWIWVCYLEHCCCYRKSSCQVQVPCQSVQTSIYVCLLVSCWVLHRIGGIPRVSESAVCFYNTNICRFLLYLHCTHPSFPVVYSSLYFCYPLIWRKVAGTRILESKYSI